MTTLYQRQPISASAQIIVSKIMSIAAKLPISNNTFNKITYFENKILEQPTQNLDKGPEKARPYPETSINCADNLK